MESPDRGIFVYTPPLVARLLGGVLRPGHGEAPVLAYLLTDSRKLVAPAGTMFFALARGRGDGHQFIDELYSRGVRTFVISSADAFADCPDAWFIRVTDTLSALQSLAGHHRSRFHFPVVGITGSNGKTVVKEWLNHLLSPDFRIVRSPRSYNSQIGVPLSVWQMQSADELAIFEAGISRPGEMSRLQEILRPDIGIFTNIGDAHDEGFASRTQKAEEKLRLFRDCRTLIYPSDDIYVRAAVANWKASDPSGAERVRFVGWGYGEDAQFLVHSINRSDRISCIHARYDGREVWTEIPFTDPASTDNIMSVWLLMLVLGVSDEVIRTRMRGLPVLAMRLELKDALNRCVIVNDSYNADLGSLRSGLEFLAQQHRYAKRTVILSDILQSGRAGAALYAEVASQLADYRIDRLIGIGPLISAQAHLFTGLPASEFHPSTEAFLEVLHPQRFREEAILLKGARSFAFERISRRLEEKRHQTRLETDLSAISYNLSQFRECLRPGTRIMAMVKALSYGAGAYEIAGLMQFHRVDWLAVAYADEGVDLRRQGIRLPIMVMNPEPSAFQSLTEYDLQPEIFSFDMLEAFSAFLIQEGIKDHPVHVKFDTGMHRLGFLPGEADELATRMAAGGLMRVQTAFTHLVASEDPASDDFTRVQTERFSEACRRLESGIGYGFLRHVANTSAIARFPDLQFDMVRLGIGLYGVHTGGFPNLNLKEASTLRTTVAQIKHVEAGLTVGYNRKGRVDRPSLIATIRIGYADGYPRCLSNGVGSVLIEGVSCPVIGNVCMDMTMIDVTDHPGNVRPGTEVVVFGPELSVARVAALAGTIPYEILTGISPRVQRVYFEQ
ncbi:MAG: bifunctional UDP-N-acetylmuramoyl-tripeptide:D-alanyl-D-alanine ligase/alanine racemase [Chitinophagaceae bacterium]